MKQEKQTPAPLGTSGESQRVCVQQTIYTEAKVMNLPRVQRKVYDLLRSGGKYSVYDITTRLRLADPRGHISALRRKGIDIRDEWRHTSRGERFKVYFIGKGGPTL